MYLPASSDCRPTSAGEPCWPNLAPRTLIVRPPVLTSPRRPCRHHRPAGTEPTYCATTSFSTSRHHLRLIFVECRSRVKTKNVQRKNALTTNCSGKAIPGECAGVGAAVTAERMVTPLPWPVSWLAASPSFSRLQRKRLCNLRRKITSVIHSLFDPFAQFSIVRGSACVASWFFMSVSELGGRRTEISVISADTRKMTTHAVAWNALISVACFVCSVLAQTTDVRYGHRHMYRTNDQSDLDHYRHHTTWKGAVLPETYRCEIRNRATLHFPLSTLHIHSIHFPSIHFPFNSSYHTHTHIIPTHP